MEHFVTTIALIGIVIVVASLLSGALERAGVPLVAVFLALGAALGPWGLGLVDIELTSPSLHILATLGLVLVLFSDAVTIDAREVWARRHLAWRLLGPGTIVSSILIVLAAWFLLGVPAPAAAILGAALASTDPVLLRSVLRSGALSPASRIALRMEAGMNDVVLLPIVVISMVLLRNDAVGAQGLQAEMGRHVIGLFLLGPALGALIGWLGIVALARVRERMSMRRDYESLYALGLALSSYAAAEAVGGSGFLSAFAAGFMVASQDVELCDCFLEYGEATAEMLLLLTFVALGTSLVWTGLTVIDGRTLLFAAVALIARTVVLYPVLLKTGLTLHDRRLVALIGPRGLSTLLLVLLPVFAGAPYAEQLFAVACLVVLLSIALHGGGIAFFLRANRSAIVPVTVSPRGPRPTLDSGPDTAKPVNGATDEVPELIEIPELQTLMSRGEAPIILDVRANRNYWGDSEHAAGAVRVQPDDAVRSATEHRLPQTAILVVYCACPNEETSTRVVRELRRAGWRNTRALVGGWAGWKAAGLPVELRQELSSTVGE